MVKAQHGLDVSNSPILTAQGLISCGSTRHPEGSTYFTYTNGCDGGSGPSSFTYALDHGLTTVGCWPYQQGASNFEMMMDPALGEVAA